MPVCVHAGVMPWRPSNVAQSMQGLSGLCSFLEMGPDWTFMQMTCLCSGGKHVLVTASTCTSQGCCNPSHALAAVCRRGVLKAFFIQLAIVSNHQNGRDTHLRQVKVYGPLQQSVKLLGNQLGFNTVDFSMYATVR